MTVRRTLRNSMAWLLGGWRQHEFQHWVWEGAYKERAIVAARSTGIGSRYADMLVASRMAHGLGAQFRFAWPDSVDSELHGIGSAEQTFAPHYLREHLLALETAHHGQRIPVNLSRKEARRLLHDNGVRLFLVKVSLAENPADPLHQLKLASPSYREIFDGIAFHDRLEAARGLAASLGNHDLALHLRRGDVVYGENRYGGRDVDKVLPLPLIIAVLDRLAATEEAETADPIRRILLVSESPCLSAFLLNRYSQSGLEITSTDVLAAGLGGEKDVTDFFDLCALTQAKRLLGASSHFVKTAALISGATMLNVNAWLDQDSQKRVLIEHIVEGDYWSGMGWIGPYELATACQSACYCFWNDLSQSRKEELLVCAVKADPSNPVLWLAMICRSIKRGDEQTCRQCCDAFSQQSQALDVLLSLATRQFLDARKTPFSKLMHARGFLAEGTMSDLEQLPLTTQHPVLLLVLSCYQLAIGDPQKSLEILHSEDSQWEVSAIELQVVRATAIRAIQYLHSQTD